MKRRIFIVLLAVLIAVLPVALLCSCNGCSSKTVSAPAGVQSTAAVQVKPAPAVEKEVAPAAEEIAPEVQPAEAAQVAEETPAEAVAEEAAVEPLAEVVVEPEAEEESAPVEEESASTAVAPASTAETEEPAEVAITEEPAEEPAVEKAPAQEAAQPEAVSEEPAPAAAEPETEPAAVAAVAEEEGDEAEKSCGRHILTLGISPWGWQHFHIDESGIDDKNSTYGLGGKIAYTYLFNSGFYVGAEAAYETYFIDHKDNFHDIMFFVDGGYNFALTDKFGLYVGLGGGFELEFYDCECSAVGLAKGDLGLGYSLTEHWILGAGCDFIFSFPTKSGTNYIGFQIVPCITASYKF